MIHHNGDTMTYIRDPGTNLLHMVSYKPMEHVIHGVLYTYGTYDT